MSYEFMLRMVATYERVHNNRYWKEIKTTINQEQLKEGVIADLGCGPGLLLRDLGKAFLPKKLIGVDLSSIMLSRAEKEIEGLPLEFELIEQHLQDNPHLTFTADAIFSSRVLRSFQAQDVIMSSIHQALNPNGYLVIVDWMKASISDYAYWFNHQNNEFEDLNPADIIQYHRKFSRYDLEDWRYIVTNFGYTVIHAFQIDAVHCCLIAQKLQ